MMSAKVDGLTVSASRRGPLKTGQEKTGQGRARRVKAKPVQTRPGPNVALESSRQIILDNIETMLPGRQCSAIIGPNGAGKTTLLQAMIGLQPIDSGDLSWHDANLVGRRLDDMTLLERARTVAWVPAAELDAPGFEVLDIVILGRQSLHHGYPRLEDVAKARAALDFVEALGLQDRQVDSLSQGEKKRVAIARGIAAETPVIFFDEPTANLDIEMELGLMAKLQSLADQGRTIVASLHNLDLAYRWASHCVCLNKGRVVKSGAPHHVLTQELIADVFQVRMTRSICEDQETHLLFHRQDY